MDLSSEFVNLSLDSFESDRVSEDYSFVGLTVDSRITDALVSIEDSQVTIKSSAAPDQGVTVERFFEECFDTGVGAFSESSFGEKTFIGSGATMEVYKSQWNDRGQKVALKYFKTPVWSRLVESKARSDDYHRLLEACMLELRVLTDEFIKRHENIANLLGVSWHPRGDSICPILIMELACEEHPTLKEYLALSTPIKTRLELVRDVLEGLSALHHIAVVHGDIKPENILIFKSSSAIGISARLSDFGFCRPTADYKFGAGGTPYWNAPECLPNAPADLKVEAYGEPRDVYSLGLLAFNAITRQMPFGSADAEKISELKMSDKVSALLTEMLQSPAGGLKLGGLLLLKKGTSSRSKTKVPDEVIAIIGRMVQLQPGARASIDEIRASLSSCTSNRASAVKPGRESSQNHDRFTFSTSVLQARYSHGNQGIGDIGSNRNLDSSLPRDLKDALYETLLRTANNGSNQEKTRALNRLGVFFLNGFGTAKSFKQAFSYFCRAAECGSIEARKMVFRMERATDRLPERVEASLSNSVRASWMIDAIMDTMKAGDVDARMVPEGMDVGACTDKIRRVLMSIDPYAVRYGLIRDVEHNVVRLMAYNASLDQTRSKTREDIYNAGKASPALSMALAYTFADNADALDQVLTTNSVPVTFLNRLVTVASDYSLRRALRTLCVKHGADPNYVDTLSGRNSSPLSTAAMSNDYYTVMTLLDCGANAMELFGAIYRAVNHGSSAIMSVILQMIEPETARQFLDGIIPDMNGVFAEHDTPPDNQNPPPLFYAVLFDRLDKIYALLVRGANPDVRFGGWTAVHLAIRMLHPSALLLLLAFGADPNARSSKDGYTTPLHMLSEVRLRLPEDSPGLDVGTVDFMLRPYQPLAVRTGDLELVQRQALIVRILLNCGAKPSAHCIDGFTPLMTSIVSTSPDAKALTSVMLEAGVPLEDQTSRGETILHICAMANDLDHLKMFFDHGGKSLANSMDISRSTPLILACLQEGSAQIVKLLLENEADPTIRGPFNLSALDVALLIGDTTTINHLVTRASSFSKHALEDFFSGVDDHERNVFHFCLSSKDNAAATERFNRLLSLVPPDLASTLLAQGDQNGYTPYHLALFRRNTAVCRILTLEFGATDVSSSLLLQSEDDAFPNIQNILERREQSMDADDSERETIMEECEYTGAKRSLSPAEIRLQSDLDEAIGSDGKSSRRAIWCMDTLGTVHERYGRLRMAQDIYNMGWLKSLEILGPKNPITHDLASKLLRVLRDRGAEDTEVPYVADWHAVNGKNTLREGILFDNEGEPSGVFHSQQAGFDGAGKSGAAKQTSLCVRAKCGKPSTLVCDGCKFVAYCSESCRVQDIIDPKIQHLLGCVAAEEVNLSPAIRVEGKDMLHPDARNTAQREWDRLYPSMRGLPPPMAPPTRRLNIGMVTPAFFKKPVALVIPKNSIVAFTNNHLFEIRFDRRANSPWTAGGTAVAVRDMDIVLRPVESAVRAESEKTAGREPIDQEVMIWMEIGFDCDFSAYFPGFS